MLICNMKILDISRELNSPKFSKDLQFLSNSKNISFILKTQLLFKNSNHKTQIYWFFKGSFRQSLIGVKIREIRTAIQHEVMKGEGAHFLQGRNGLSIIIHVNSVRITYKNINSLVWCLINFMYQLDWATVCPDFYSNIYLQECFR